jgi:hypothetical protein
VKRLASLRQTARPSRGWRPLLDCCLNGTDGKQRGFPHLPKIKRAFVHVRDLFVAERCPLGVCVALAPDGQKLVCNRHEPFQSVDENRNRFEFFAAQVGAAQVGAAQVGAAQVGAAQVGAAQVGAAQVASRRSAAQVGVAQVGAAQVGAAQVGAAQVGAAQVGAAQVGAAQVGGAQVGAAQVGVAQVGARRSAARRLAARRLAPRRSAASTSFNPFPVNRLLIWITLVLLGAREAACGYRLSQQARVMSCLWPCVRTGNAQTAGAGSRVGCTGNRWMYSTHVLRIVNTWGA